MGIYRRKWEAVSPSDVKRLRLLGVVFALFVLLILYRAFTFQVWKRQLWCEMAPAQFQRRVKLIANRGTIYDRNMNILAMDLPVTSLAIDPTILKDMDQVAGHLSDVFGDDKAVYGELLKKNRSKSFVLVNRDISEVQKEKAFQLVKDGLIVINGRKRVRPYQKIAPQVLGITNGDHQGVGGIEQALNDVLCGKDGWAIYQKDALNRKFSCPDYPVEQSIDGNHIVLTLDHAYQTILDEELERGISVYKAKSGNAVLMDPFSGEILAIGSAIGDRLDEKGDRFNAYIQNRAVQSAFEPGSTFKIVTLAASIEEELFQSNTLIHCENGTFLVDGHPIRDHNEAYAWLTLSQVIEKSSNIGIAKVGMKLGKKVLYKYTRDFGFGNRTGIGLPGEASGILHPVYKWVDFLTATVSFGQGVSATTLQLAGMISVIANGGKLMKPVICKSILDPTGKVVKTCNSQVIRLVISENTAQQVRIVLENTVSEGGGMLAAVEGVRIAGKTGTAQKSLPGYEGYYPGAYVSSFAGFWPAETPMYALVVVLDEPAELYWGSKSAAPVFSRIVSRIAGLPVSPSLYENLKNEKPNSRFVFSGLEKNVDNEVVDNRKEIDSPYHVPMLIGLSVRESLKKLTSRNIEARVSGNGIVLKQDPAPGTRITEGTICSLICGFISNP